MLGAITCDIVGSVYQGGDNKADIRFPPMQRDFGFSPATTIDDDHRA